MHWAIWQQMKSPPKGFEDVVRMHFKQRQRHVSVSPCELVHQACCVCFKLALPAAMLFKVSKSSVEEAVLKLQHRNCRRVCIVSNVRLMKSSSYEKHA